MTNDDFTVTNYHLNIALQHGKKIAEHHVESGTEQLTDMELWDQFPEDEIVFQVTGEKMHDVPENYLILDAFEEGYYYYDGWSN